jgi:hypothetical protein
MSSDEEKRAASPNDTEREGRFPKTATGPRTLAGKARSAQNALNPIFSPTLSRYALSGNQSVGLTHVELRKVKNTPVDNFSRP